VRLNLTLDFTSHGALLPELCRRLDEIAAEKRQAYNDLIDNLGNGRLHDIDWWVSLPASRNTHAGKLFGRCMQLALARELANEGHAVWVHTDDAAQAAALRRSGFSVTFVSGASPWRAFIHDVLGTLFHVIFSAWYSRTTRRLARPIPEGAGLLEVYVQRDSFKDGAFNDRYYPGFYESLNVLDRTKLFYFPIFYRIRNYRELFLQMRRSPQNFLLREDFLSWRDYVFAFSHWWRAGRLKGMRANFCGFEIGEMLDAELDAGRFTNAVMQALLAYRFWLYRAPKTTLSLVDWYEGHGIDHATAAGIRWHGSRDCLIAMRGIAPESYLSTTPTAGEVRAKTVSTRWAVIGAEKRRTMSECFPQLTIGPAPGMRHLSLRSIVRNRSGHGPQRVLILLSIESDLAKLVARVLSETDCKARWLVKRHPGMPRAEAEALFTAIAANVTFVEGDFAQLLAEVDVVAGLGTNTLIEASTIGIPVICISGGNLPTELLFGPTAPVWWRVVYDGSGLSAALAEARDIPDVVSGELQEAYLGPFDPGILRQLLLG
jgi:hypothetical protein